MILVWQPVRFVMDILYIPKKMKCSGDSKKFINELGYLG